MTTSLVSPFSIARRPRIEFGSGSARKLPELAARYGKRLLIVTGALALSGLAAVRDGLPAWHEGGARAGQPRARQVRPGRPPLPRPIAEGGRAEGVSGDRP